MIYNFEELFSDVTKYGKKVPKNEYCLQGKFPIIDQGKEDIAGYSNDDAGIFKNVPAIIFGDHTRILKFVTEPCLLGADGVKLLKSKKPQINDKYLFYALKNVRIPNTGYNRHFKWLKEARINIPSREQQDKIVATLETLEKLTALRDRQLQKIDDLVKSRFIELFGDLRLNSNGYPVHSLSEYIEFLTSGSRGWARYCVEGGNEWFITIKNVKDCRISVDNMQSINAPDNTEAKRTRVQEGDLLISITADLGRTGVVNKEIAEHGAYINQHLTCIRLNRKVLEPLYVAYFMESPAGKAQFISKNQSAVKAGLNFNSINTLQLLIPPMSVQRKFLSFVSQTDKSKYRGEESLRFLAICYKKEMNMI